MDQVNEGSQERLTNFQNKVVDVFAELKGISHYDELISRSLRLSDDMGYLVCLSELFKNDDEILSRLTNWRIAAAATYHDSFTPTLASTHRWYQNLLLNVPDRILFLVINKHGSPIGHIGYDNGLEGNCQLEIDNVIRGEQAVEPGIMSASLQTLIQWAKDNFNPLEIFLHTWDDNTHAIRFYEKNGFQIHSKTPMKLIDNENGGGKLVPLTPEDKTAPDREFVRMTYR